MWSEPAPDSFHGFFGLLPAPERGEPQVALAARSESGPGRRHHVRFVQERVEELPRRHSRRSLDPEIRRIAAAVDGEPGGFEADPHDPRVLHVEGDQPAYLR